MEIRGTVFLVCSGLVVLGTPEWMVGSCVLVSIDSVCRSAVTSCCQNTWSYTHKKTIHWVYIVEKDTLTIPLAPPPPDKACISINSIWVLTGICWQKSMEEARFCHFYFSFHYFHSPVRWMKIMETLFELPMWEMQDILTLRKRKKQTRQTTSSTY